MIHEQYTTNLFRRPPAIWDFAPSRSPFLSGSGCPAASKDEEAGLRPGSQSPPQRCPRRLRLSRCSKAGRNPAPPGACQAQPGISPRSVGMRRQLTSRCPSGMLLNEWAASQRIRTIPCMAIWASADFYCSACMSEYELKSKKGSMGHKIAGGTYDTFIRSTAAILIRLSSFRITMPRPLCGNPLAYTQTFFLTSVAEKCSPQSSSARLRKAIRLTSPPLRLQTIWGFQNIHR